MKFRLINKRVLFGLLGAGLLAGSLSAYSHSGEGHWGHGERGSPEFRAKMVERVANRLDLNAEQKQRLNALAEQMHQQRLALMGGNTQPRGQLLGLMAGTQFDRSKAQALVTEKTTQIQQQSPALIAAMGDFYDSLNPAQQQKVREFMQKRGHHGPF
ncbi:Spy/CpxP family protein refolding chaperone [Curvibacter sp. RS43]|jgi:protein CpxP|uniref:Spy/CpxP family protein refolding chaperone n=1 Tax=Curvibacter microcysteis TaxID=3026419 RepID=UPI002361E155|nr:Spy/CpxP family protein refolding chaperone [Curvibacter sp. RS43]MDD0809008.1 Spy/CpxP family protein refolding chaperone [Curvibacter sp. RS43]